MSGARQIRVEGDADFRNWLASQPVDELKSRVKSLIDMLRSDPFLGEQIQRRLWPKTSEYQGINNLYRVRVTNQARMTYTLIARGHDVMVVRILELFPTHAEYDRRFGYD